MNILDMRTIVFSTFLTTFVCLLLMLMLWFQNRKRFDGAGFWIADYSCLMIALMLIAQRGRIPDWASMALSNTMVIAGSLIGYIALERFVGIKRRHLFSYIYLGIFAAIHLYFTSFQPVLSIRILNLSIAQVVFYFLCMHLAIFQVSAMMRRMTLGVGLVFGGFCLVSGLRIIAIFTEDNAATDYFQSGAFETTVLLAYEMLLILLAYSLILMFNQRLLLDVVTQEEKFSKAFRSSPYAIILTRLKDGRIIDINRGFEVITGFMESEVLGRTTIELGLWDNEEDRLDAVRSLSPHGSMEGKEYRFRIKSGERITGLFAAEIIQFNNETHILSSINNITERKLAEEHLKRQKAVIEAINYVLIETLASDHETDIGRIGLSVAQALTNSPQGWIGLEHSSGSQTTLASSGLCWDFIENPESTTRNTEIRRIIDHVMRDGTPAITNAPLAMCAPNDATEESQSIQNFLAIPLKDAGRTIGILSLANKPQDYAPYDQEAIESLSIALVEVLKRKRADAERKLLFAALDQAGEMIVVTDPEGKIQYVNPAFERGTGYTRDEATGQKPRILKSGQHDEAFYRDMWDTISHGKTWQGRMINRRKDGSVFTEEATISPVRDTSGSIVNYLSIRRDITEELNSQMEKTKLENQLQQAQRVEAIGRLAGGVAHDFNNMLSIILGYSESILADLRINDPLHEGISEIVEAGRRSAALTRQLLAFSRRQTLQPRMLDLNQLIRDLDKMLHRLIGEDIEVIMLLSKNLAPVKADPGQIEQVIMNLAVNARDAMPEGGKLIIETENIELDALYCDQHMGLIPGSYVMMAVSDTGCGMDREIMSQIFEPFFTTKEMWKGTGLGLSTAYGIVKQSSGDISVYSEPGQGTTLKVYLPQIHVDLTEPEVPVTRDSKDDLSVRILVVEDETSLRELFQKMMSSLGYRVQVAANGMEALFLIEDKGMQFDLIITDVIMPGMNGAALVEEIHKTHPEIKVLFMSGYTDNAIAHYGVLDSEAHFIPKPFTIRSLVVKIREVLQDSMNESV